MSPREAIAYASKGDGGWEIYRINPDGSGQTQLTHNRLQTRFALWSPDHRHIAYGVQERADRWQWSLHVMDADGRNARKLADFLAAKSPKAWSSDGSRIFFVAGEGDARQIYSVAMTGGAPVQLTHDGVNDDLRLSPDGRQIVFTSRRDGNAEIYLMNLRDRRLTRLTREQAGDDYPLWSPDGSRLAVQVIQDKNYDVDLVDVSNGGRTAIGHAPEFDGQFDWAPDGNALLLISSRSGKDQLYRSTRDGQLTVLTTDETLNPDW